jgi:hypothetical protein
MALARWSRFFDPNMYRAIGPDFFLIAFENLRWTRLRGVRTMEGSSETVSSHKVPDLTRATPSARTCQALAGHQTHQGRRRETGDLKPVTG